MGIDIDAVNDDLSIHVDASSAGDFTVTPRYDVDSGNTDVVVTYAKGDTEIDITASQDEQSITISKQVDDDNKVTPTIGSNGDFSVAWERSLGDDNSLTTTLTPNESVDLEWKDSDWTANINLPLDGTS